MDTKSTHGNLHVYPQETWHDEAYIVGDREALLILRALIDQALRPGPGTEEVELFAGDGEGYAIHVVNLEGDEGWNKIAVPYTGNIAKEKRETAVWPWQIIEDRKKRAKEA